MSELPEAVEQAIDEFAKAIDKEAQAEAVVRGSDDLTPLRKAERRADYRFDNLRAAILAERDRYAEQKVREERRRCADIARRHRRHSNMSSEGPCIADQIEAIDDPAEEEPLPPAGAADREGGNK